MRAVNRESDEEDRHPSEAHPQQPLRPSQSTGINTTISLDPEKYLFFPSPDVLINRKDNSYNVIEENSADDSEGNEQVERSR